MIQDTTLRQFLRTFEIETNPPASERQLDELEEKLGIPLPAEIRDYYRICDGGCVCNDRSYMELLSIDGARARRRVLGFKNSFWGYYSVAENNDSNPVCVFCKSPLTGYVAVVNHDDNPRLLARSLDGFLNLAMARVAESDFYDTAELESEFAGRERTDRDIEIARQLIHHALDNDTLDPGERTDALCFAGDLFPDIMVDEIAALYGRGNEYVRRYVIARLERIAHPAGKVLAYRFRRH
ncbi:MAG TPA: SMI1/KNR4 family protein [Candidatus Kapabacteria bacterium]|nr:SMI1/KNR4 family protein [Candidatus Kapabacteria bacterium]